MTFDTKKRPKWAKTQNRKKEKNLNIEGPAWYLVIAKNTSWMNNVCVCMYALVHSFSKLPTLLFELWYDKNVFNDID